MGKLAYIAPDVAFFEADDLDAIVATMSGGHYMHTDTSYYQDDLYCPGGALWKCVTPPSYITPYGSYTKSVWYVPKKYVSALIDVVSQDQYLSTMEKLVKGTTTVAAVAASVYEPAVGVAFAEITATLNALKTFFDVVQIDPFAFSDVLIDSIRKCAGGAEGNAVYKFGVKLTVRYLYGSGLLEYAVATWNETPAICGPQNHRGKWVKNDDMFISQ